jgi:hypothetical protein
MTLHLPSRKHCNVLSGIFALSLTCVLQLVGSGNFIDPFLCFAGKVSGPFYWGYLMKLSAFIVAL